MLNALFAYDSEIIIIRFLGFNLKFNKIDLPISGVGKLRPAGQFRSAKGESVANEHVIFLNVMRPAKENFAAREHVNMACRAKLFLN